MRDYLRSPLLVIVLAILLCVSVTALLLYRNQTLKEIEGLSTEREQLRRENEDLRKQVETLLANRILHPLHTHQEHQRTNDLSKEELDVLRELAEKKER
jgi:hypothetical protein